MMLGEPGALSTPGKVRRVRLVWRRLVPAPMQLANSQQLAGPAYSEREPGQKPRT